MNPSAPALRLSRKARLVGGALFALVLYGTLSAVVYLASLLALQQGVRLDLPWFAATQKSLYRNGHVSVSNWLSIPGCIEPDPELIYVPAIGTCTFDDIEFKTTLTFTAEGRETGPKPAGAGIAVIGDSHAMGWGANDEETFAAQLQALSGRPVYNLGVASYGTARELIRLQKSGVLDKVDTVILQYCNNDKSENLQFDSASKQALHDKVFAPPQTPVQPNRLAQLADGYGYALAAPFRSLSERLRRKNFEPHYAALMTVLDKHRELLAGKRVIVFYANPYGQRYRNFPSGSDATMPNVEFVDLGLRPADHRKLDNHMTPAGHRKAAERLQTYLKTPPTKQQD
jgi:hypothetical protein